MSNVPCSLDGFIAREDGGIEWLHNSGHGEVDKGEDRIRSLYKFL